MLDGGGQVESLGGITCSKYGMRYRQFFMQKCHQLLDASLLYKYSMYIVCNVSWRAGKETKDGEQGTRE